MSLIRFGGRDRSWRVARVVGLVLIVACAIGWVVGSHSASPMIVNLRAQGFAVTFADLQARYPAVPDAENAYETLESACQRIDQSWGEGPVSGVDILKPDWQWIRHRSVPRDEKSRDQWRTRCQPLLSSNRVALEDVKTALRRPQSWRPHWTNLNGFLVGTRIVTLLQAECEWAMTEGKPATAAAGLTNLLRLAWAIDGQPSYDGVYCPGRARAAALDSLENLLGRGILTDPELLSIDAALCHTRREGTVELFLGAEVAARKEQFWYSIGGCITDENERGFTGFVWQTYGRIFGASHEKALFDRYARSLVDSKLPPLERIRAADTEMTPGSRGPAPTGPPRSGRAAPVGCQPSVVERDVNDQARLLAARAACALERWRLVHPGRLPDAAFDELVPAFLAEVPKDPIDGRPLRYRQWGTGYVFYSVGADGQDNAGKEHLERYDQTYDITFRVESSSRR